MIQEPEHTWTQLELPYTTWCQVEAGKECMPYCHRHPGDDTHQDQVCLLFKQRVDGLIVDLAVDYSKRSADSDLPAAPEGQRWPHG